MSNYDGLTLQPSAGTFYVKLPKKHPIVLDTEMRGGLRLVSGTSGDLLTDISGQRLQDGMVAYLKNGYTTGSIIRKSETYYRYISLPGETRDVNTGRLPNSEENWIEFVLGLTDETRPTGDIYHANAKLDFTTKNENSTLTIASNSLKNLAYTTGESVLINSTLFDRLYAIFNAGEALYDNTNLYNTGNWSLRPFDAVLITMISIILFSTIYTCGNSSNTSYITYTAGDSTNNTSTLFIGGMSQTIYIPQKQDKIYDAGTSLASNYDIYTVFKCGNSIVSNQTVYSAGDSVINSYPLYKSGSSLLSNIPIYTSGSSKLTNYTVYDSGILPRYRDILYKSGSSLISNDRIYISGPSLSTNVILYRSGSSSTSTDTIYKTGTSFSTDIVYISGSSLTSTDTIYASGTSLFSTDTIYTFGSSFSLDTIYTSGSSIIPTNNIYSAGSSISNNIVIYISGSSINSNNIIYNSGTSIINNNIIYNSGDSLMFNDTYTTSISTIRETVLLNSGDSETIKVLYEGGTSSSVGTLIFEGGGAFLMLDGSNSLDSGNAYTTEYTTQSDVISSGSSDSIDYTLYSSGSASSVFGQVIESGNSTNVVIPQETTLEGIVKQYNKNTGSFTLEQLTSISGIFGGVVDYTLNLTGKRGSSIFSNYGAPISMIGRNGDTYIDKLTRNFYVKQPSWKML